MNSCGLTCVLFIWINFLWPIIVSSFYLLIKKRQIEAKGKYFLLSTIGGYALFIGFNFLISFLAGNFIEVTNAEGMNILALSTTIILLVPPVIFSHILFKKTVNKTSKDMADPTKRIVS